MKDLSPLGKFSTGQPVIGTPVPSDEKQAAVEALARMAARLAGRDPDEHVRLKLGEIIAFDDPVWRYPDFLARGEAAYEALIGQLQLPERDEGPAEGQACYRYKTRALAGPWRRRPEQALTDALNARQAEIDERGVAAWFVHGAIERSECGKTAPCLGVYPPE